MEMNDKTFTEKKSDTFNLYTLPHKKGKKSILFNSDLHEGEQATDWRKDEIPPVVNNINIFNIYNINKLPEWIKLSKPQKLKYFFDNLIDDNHKAMTLHFSFDFIDKAMLKSPTKLQDYIRRRLSANLKNYLGYLPDFAFILEHDNKDVLHLHGIIKAPSNQMTDIKRALKLSSFGVSYNKHPMRLNILRLDDITKAEGWYNYMMKEPYFATKTMYICRNIIREIKKDYERKRNSTHTRVI